MPSREHDVLVDMVRARPELVPRLLRHAGLPVPAAPLTVVDATFSVALYRLSRAWTTSASRLPSCVNSVGCPRRLACQS